VAKPWTKKTPLRLRFMGYLMTILRAVERGGSGFQGLNGLRVEYEGL